MPINLYSSISKLENIQEKISRSSQQRFPGMLHDMADFVEHDLPWIIDNLRQEQQDSDQDQELIKELEIQIEQQGLVRECEEAAGNLFQEVKHA